MIRYFLLLFTVAVVQASCFHAVCLADTVTTTFASNNGQAGNMFDVNVLATGGIDVTEFELNIDFGSWDVELYTRDGTYVGNETNSGAWTLVDTVTNLAGAGLDSATSWDTADLSLAAGIQAFYINVTDGLPLNYTNGTTEGALFASNSDLEIFEGTGNAVNFGRQFRPRVWNGSIIYNVASVPEPGMVSLFACGIVWLAARRRRCFCSNA